MAFLYFSCHDDAHLDFTGGPEYKIGALVSCHGVDPPEFYIGGPEYKIGALAKRGTYFQDSVDCAPLRFPTTGPVASSLPVQTSQHTTADSYVCVEQKAPWEYILICERTE